MMLARMKFINNKQGFAPIIIVIAIAIFVALAGGGYVVYQAYFAPTIDGGGKIIFCTGEQCNNVKATSTVDTSNWKTYTNTKYGFEVQYPQEWDISIPNNTADVIVLFHQKNSQENTENPVLWISVLEKYKDKELQEVFNGVYEPKYNFSTECQKITTTAGASGYSCSTVNGDDHLLFVSNGLIFEIFNSMLNKTADKVISSFKFTTPQADTSNWKTYTNTKYGFEFKYPADLAVEFWATTTTSDPDKVEFHVYDPAFNSGGKVGQEVRTELNEVRFSLYPYTAESFEKKVQQSIDGGTQEWDKNSIQSKVIKSPSGDITVRFLQSGLVGPYLEGLFHNNKYIFKAYAIFHDELAEGILSTFKFIEK